MTQVLIHAGAFWADTSAMSEAMHQNAEKLSARGYSRIRRSLVLGDDPADGWTRLVRRAAGDRHQAVIASDAALSWVPEARAAAMLRELDDAPVKAVLTLRPLSSAVPAAWLDHVQRGGTETFGTFVAAVQADGLDVLDVVDRWTRLVGTEGVTVVTVPERCDLALLWHRVCEAMGIDPADLPDPERRGVGAVDAVAAELLRRMNERPGGPERRRPVTLAPRESHPALRLPSAAQEWAVRGGEDVAARLVDSGGAVVGDVADLVVTTPPPSGRPTTDSPESLAASVLLDAAVNDLIDLASLLAPNYENVT